MRQNHDREVRFKDADWFDVFRERSIVLGGVGGIGSWLSLFLARANPKNLSMFDDDNVDIGNLGGQFFANSQIGEHKVLAAQQAIEGFTDMGTGKTIMNLRYEKGGLSDVPLRDLGAVFVGFDNMKARAEMFYDWEDICDRLFPRENSIFIDGRMLAEGYQIFAIGQHDRDARILYKEIFLKNDSEIEDLPCTLRATSHAAASLAANMMGIYTNHLSNIVLGDNIREVPFFYDFDIGLMNQSVKFVKDFIEPESITEEKHAHSQ